MPITLTTTEELETACQELAQSDYMTIDTEFIRERTYYPELCLVQLASETCEVIVDPLAKGMDLAPLVALLQNEKVTKVFHSGKQDIEIFYYLSGSIPQNVFDTQVAAMVCGFGAAASYASLVDQLVGVSIDKSSRFTDWSKRPLSQKQLDYAIGDVTYLRTVYHKLKEKLQQSGRQVWLGEELANLLSPETYQNNPEKLLRRICPKGASSKFTGVLRAMIAWREATAIRLNKPRGHVLKDPAMLEYAAIIPKTMDDLDRLRGSNRVPHSLRASLLEAVAAFEPVKLDATLQKNKLTAAHKPVLELLKVLLASIAQSHGVAERLIATTDDLRHIVLEEYDQTPTMGGWRRDIFGDQAVSLCKGECALVVKDGAVRLC